jgi:hypothetical protein
MCGNEGQLQREIQAKNHAIHTQLSTIRQFMPHIHSFYPCEQYDSKYTFQFGEANIRLNVDVVGIYKYLNFNCHIR